MTAKPSRQSALIETNVRWLRQALRLVGGLDDTSYTTTPRGLARIGRALISGTSSSSISVSWRAWSAPTSTTMRVGATTALSTAATPHRRPYAISFACSKHHETFTRKESSGSGWRTRIAMEYVRASWNRRSAANSRCLAATPCTILRSSQSLYACTVSRSNPILGWRHRHCGTLHRRRRRRHSVHRKLGPATRRISSHGESR